MRGDGIPKVVHIWRTTQMDRSHGAYICCILSGRFTKPCQWLPSSLEVQWNRVCVGILMFIVHRCWYAYLHSCIESDVCRSVGWFTSMLSCICQVVLVSLAPVVTVSSVSLVVYAPRPSHHVLVLVSRLPIRQVVAVRDSNHGEGCKERPVQVEGCGAEAAGDADVGVGAGGATPYIDCLFMFPGLLRFVGLVMIMSMLTRRRLSMLIGFVFVLVP